MSEVNLVAVGQRIFNIRKYYKLTQEEFGKKFNAKKGIVSRWESGLNLPNRQRIEEIASLGGISVDELLYGPYKDFCYKEFIEYWENEKNDIPSHIKKKGISNVFNDFFVTMDAIEPIYDKEGMYIYIKTYFMHESNMFDVFDDYEQTNFKVRASRFRIIKNNEYDGVKNAYEFLIAVEASSGQQKEIGTLGCFVKVLDAPLKKEQNLLILYSTFDYSVISQDYANLLRSDSKLFKNLPIDQESFSTICNSISKDKTQELVTQLLNYQIGILNGRGQMMDGLGTYLYKVSVKFLDVQYMEYTFDEKSGMKFSHCLETSNVEYLPGS